MHHSRKVCSVLGSQKINYDLTNQIHGQETSNPINYVACSFS